MHLFLLSFLTLVISEHANRVETIFINEWDNGPVEQVYKNHSFPRDQSNRRRVEDGAFEPIRFHVHIDDKGLDEDTKEYLTAIVEAAVGYLSKIMRVSPVEGNLQLCHEYRKELGICKDTCGEVRLPYSHIHDGIPNTDTVLYAFADPNAKWCSGGVYAYAGMCYRDLYGRPIAGRINFCKLQGRRRKWRSDVEVALHEISHIVFASQSYFGRFRDEDGSLRPEYEVWKKVNDGSHQRGFVITPRVKQWVRDHFGCRSMIGAELESQGESYTQWKHWDAQYFFEEMLTGYIDGSPRTFSGLNLALMEDSGWYEANWGREGKLKWGKNQGCTFASGACIKNGYPSSDHYCNSDKRGCTHWARGIGACDLRAHGSTIPSYFRYFRDSSQGGDKYANYCPIMKPMIDENEFTSMCNDETDNWLLDMMDHGALHSAESRCVEGAIARPGYTIRGDNSICYPHTCIGSSPFWDGVKIRVFDKDIICLKEDSGKKKSLGGGYSGSIKCPVLHEICPPEESNPLYCDNGDWHNVGWEGEGYCECWPGYAGPKCTAYFREPNPRGCYWDDANVVIQHDSILSSDHVKIVKSIGGMGPSRYTVKATYMRWSSRKDTGCKALSYSVKNLIVALWEGTCGFETKALNAQNAGAEALLIVSTSNFGHKALTDSSRVRIPVRQVPNAFGTWLLKQSGGVKASIKCHEMMKVHNSPSSTIREEARTETRPSLEAPREQACEPLHMYPTDSNGRVLNTLGSMEIPFPVHSVGFSFMPKDTIKLAGARFEASLSTGIKGRFTLYQLDDVVARTSWFHGTGAKDFYTAKFETVQTLMRYREYTLAFWIDETRDNTGNIATYPIYFTVDDPYENDMATNIVIRHSFKKEKLPSRPEPFSPVLDMCIEA